MAPLYFIASYPRSGNTWVRSFIFMMMRLSGHLPGEARLSEMDLILPWDAGQNFYKHLGAAGAIDARTRLTLRPAVHEHLESIGHPLKVVKSHTLLGSAGGVPTFDTSAWRGACYLVRNPLDVAPSLARLLDTSIDRAIDIMGRPLYFSPEPSAELWGSWSQNVDSWADKDGVMIVRYEDMRSDPTTHLTQLAAHAGYLVSPQVIELAIAQTSLPELQQMEASGTTFIPIRNGTFFGGGAERSYQEKLTPAQARRIIDAHHLTMERFGYLDRAAESFTTG